jgi:hypothetical protein
MRDSVKDIFDIIKTISADRGVKSVRELTNEIRRLCDDADNQERIIREQIDNSDKTLIQRIKIQIELTYAHDGRGRLSDDDRDVMRTLGNHLLLGFHPLTHCTDLIELTNLCAVMSSIYPDHKFWRGALVNDVAAARRLGGIISRSNSPLVNIQSSWYIPVDPDLPGDKPSARNRRVWVLRSRGDYMQLGPADARREYINQYDNQAFTVHQQHGGMIDDDDMNLIDDDFTWCKYTNVYERLSASNVSNIRHVKHVKHARLEQTPTFM